MKLNKTTITIIVIVSTLVIFALVGPWFTVTERQLAYWRTALADLPH